jgi:hypothetical protein
VRQDGAVTEDEARRRVAAARVGRRAWWVRISGLGRVIDGGITREAAVDLLAEKYRQYREHRPGGPVLAIEITRIRGWQATLA